MIPFQDNSVELMFESYPADVKPAMFALRDLVFETAGRVGVAERLTESLKWGEPAYGCPTGSTIRMHAKAEEPGIYRLFFHCQSRLVSTFRKLYPEGLVYEDNRAIRLAVDAEPDYRKLAHCIELALKYHQLKDLPNLGAGT